jgi:hypothetical protein
MGKGKIEDDYRKTIWWLTTLLEAHKMTHYLVDYSFLYLI